MRYRNRLLLLLSLAVLLMTSSGCQRRGATVFDAVPLETAALLHITDAQSFAVAIGDETTLWPALKTMPAINTMSRQAAFLDSVVLTDDAVRDEVMSMPMALGCLSAEAHQCFFVMCHQGKLSHKRLQKILDQGDITYVNNKVGGANEYQVMNGSDTLFMVFLDEFFYMTGASSTAASIVHQIQHPVKITTDDRFVKVHATRGSSVDACLYLNYSFLGGIMREMSSKTYENKAHSLLSSLHGLAALDVVVKKNEVVFNGYSRADSSRLLAPLKYQRPEPNTIVNILPYNVRMMVHFGMTDFLSYWSSVTAAEGREQFNKRTGLKVEEQFLSSLVEAGFFVPNNIKTPFFVARTNNPAEMQRFFDKLKAKVGVVNSISCQGYVINSLNYKGFLPQVFGPLFDKIQGCVYAVVDQYVLVANDSSVLEHVIACYRSGRTLDLDENYRAFQNNMLESANISLYVTCRDNYDLLSNYLGTSPLQFLKTNPSLLKSLQAFSIQFQGAGDLVYTCGNLRSYSDTKAADNVQWKATLEATVNGKPHIVFDHRSGAYNVVVFDVDNNMYLIDADGMVLWKKQLPEQPISEVYSVDYYKNGKWQFLFNSENYLFLVDRNGDNVDQYPHRLQQSASNGIAVFDYEGNKDYRIMVCGTDRLVYNYDIKGDEIQGWNRHRTESLVVKSVEHLVCDNKDYIVVTDQAGGIRILDRQGRIRIPLVGDLEKSPYSDFYVNKTNRKGIMLTSDKNGKLLYIKTDGSLDRTDFGDFSDKHFFLYEDFNQNNDPDFVYLDGRDLIVFNRYKKTLFSHSFNADIKTKPMFFNITRTKRLLGVVAESAREIYLIDKDGNMIVSSGLVGETPFAVGSLKNDDHINLITGVGTSLFNYKIY